MPNFDRTLWRAAGGIVAALETQRRRGQALSLPTSSLTRLEEMARQHLLARQRGWFAAADALHQSFHSDLNWLITDLKRLSGHIQPLADRTPLKVRDVYDELRALEDRFPELKVDLAETQLSVLTEPITLEDFYLGAFRLTWNWSRLAEDAALLVIAESPQSPDGREDVTHPHVLNEILCEGDAQPALRLASDSGRLFDYFEIVERVLQTYNSGSAYVSLSEWEDVRCSACDDACGSVDLPSCDACYEQFCSECLTACSACERGLCHDCSLSCLVCDQPLCRHCRATRQGRPVCPACLKKELSDADDPPPSAATVPAEDDPAVHAHRLGQAPVPAGCR